MLHEQYCRLQIIYCLHTANCDMEAAVRLVDGQNNAEGRVEYCSGGVWGTVCDNTWDAMMLPSCVDNWDTQLSVSVDD